MQSQTGVPLYSRMNSVKGRYPFVQERVYWNRYMLRVVRIFSAMQRWQTQLIFTLR